LLINWNEKSIGWFCDASEYTGFNKKLSRLLLQYMERRDSLCDLGCGPGLIDIALAPFIGHITCVDNDAFAVGAARGQALSYGFDNISAVLGDAEKLQGSWQNVIAVFHGTPALYAGKYSSLASDVFLSVIKTSNTGRIGPEEYRVRKHFNSDNIAAELDSLGVKYTLTPHSLEYGQPFRSRRDAKDFVRAYTMNPPEEAVEDYLAENLTRTGRYDFPFYLPNEKEFTILAIRRDENG